MPHLQLLNKWRDLATLATPAQRAPSAQGAYYMTWDPLADMHHMRIAHSQHGAARLTSCDRGTDDPSSPAIVHTGILLQGIVLSGGQTATR